MSPQSRGRKKKPRGRRRSQTTESNPYALVLRRFRPVAEDGDCLDVEVFVSGVLGALDVPPVQADLIADLIEFLSRKATGPALGLLRAVERLGVAADQRDNAGRAATALARAGVPEPDWAAGLEHVTFVEAWQLADVFGDQATVLTIFERDGARHGLAALLDFNHLGGWVKDILASFEPAEVLRDLRETQLESGGIVRIAALAPGRARRLIEDGISATESTIEPETGEDYAELRALMLARCRAMPAAEPPEPDREFGDADRDTIVSDFLRDRAADVPDADAVRYLARLLVDYGCDYDAGRPLRVGPGKLENFLLGYLPRKVVLDDADRAALQAVVRSWTRWAAARNDLSDAAIHELTRAVEDILEEFDESYDDVANESPAKAMLAGLPASADRADVEDMMERRMFAMPYFGTRIGDDDYPRLDPNDDDELSLLVLGEHPEFHDILADPAFAGEIDGVNPRLHLAVDEIVVRQLWDGDPPEVWAAAQRLRDAGMDRLDVVHKIAAVLVEHLWHALSDDEHADPSAYAAAVDALGRAPVRRRRNTPAAQVRTDAVLQLKITLHGSRPPIWRRLRVPAATPLDRFHWVIQGAFGWEDSHLHVFEAGGKRYAPRDFDLPEAAPSDGVPLAAVFPDVGSTICYKYDFGDSWRHDIKLEQVRTPDGVGHAVCTAGRRAAPVEDCGGIGGWAYLCDVLANPEHPEYEERLEWLGYAPDPTEFDLDAVNRALTKIPLGP